MSPECRLHQQPAWNRASHATPGPPATLDTEPYALKNTKCSHGPGHRPPLAPACWVSTPLSFGFPVDAPLRPSQTRPTLPHRPPWEAEEKQDGPSRPMLQLQPLSPGLHDTGKWRGNFPATSLSSVMLGECHVFPGESVMSSSQGPTGCPQGGQGQELPSASQVPIMQPQRGRTNASLPSKSKVMPHVARGSKPRQLCEWAGRRCARAKDVCTDRQVTDMVLHLNKSPT